MIAREQEEIRKYLEARAATQALAARIRCWEEVPPASALPIERVTWCVEEMIPAGGVTLFAGESGSYKTWLALLLARGVSRGETFLGRRCAQRDVLYLDRENPAAILRERMSLLGMLGGTGVHACPASDVSPQDSRTALEGCPTDNFRLWGAWLDDAPPGIGDARLMEIARERRPLMIFDSLIRFHQQDENSATAMAQVMAELRALATAGATVVVLHHKPKGEQSHYRGSSDIRAGVDVAFAIAQDRTAGIVKFSCFKNRLAQEFTLTLRPELTDRGDFAVVESGFASAENPIEDLRKLIEQDPGMNVSALLEKCGMRKARAALLLRQYEGEYWRVELGPRGSRKYYPLREPGEETASFE